MKASIIVPTRRRLPLLAHALASAAAQDYPPDMFEVVVVVDGDPGTTKAKVDAMWSSKAPLRYARTPHRGLSAAINRGIELSTGDCFTVLPDDDGLLPNKLSICCSYLEDHPEAEVVYSLPRYIDANGSEIATPPQLRRFLRSHKHLTWRHIQQGHGLWVHGTGTVYRRRVVERVGGWDTKLDTAEEFEWHLRLLHAGITFHGIDAVTTLYRKHGGGKSNEYSRRRAKYRRYIYSKFEVKPKAKTPPKMKTQKPDARARVARSSDSPRFTGGASTRDPATRGARKIR